MFGLLLKSNLLPRIIPQSGHTAASDQRFIFLSEVKRENGKRKSFGKMSKVTQFRWKNFFSLTADFERTKHTKICLRVALVAQWVERSHPAVEIQGSNPMIGIFVLTVNCIEKTPWTSQVLRKKIFLNYRGAQIRLSCFISWTAQPFPASLLQPMWPDLAKFRHFGKIFKVFGNFSRLYLLFGKILSLLWPILFTFGQIFIYVIGPNVEK